MKSKNKLYEATKYENVREVIQDAVNKYKDNKAFILKKKVDDKVEYTNITYAEFQSNINALGTALVSNGLQGKRIAVISKNRYEWVVTYLATLNGTGISVPLDKGLPANEIESSLQRSYADAVVFSADYIDIMKEIKSNKKTQVTEFICMDDTEEFVTLDSLISHGNDLVKQGNREFLDAEIDNEKMSIILFTSGTTSQSKAVMLSHKNIASNIYALNMAERIYDTDVNMAFLPFHHTFGSTGILLFLNNGATNVFCDGIRYIQKNLVEYKVSVFVCVPLLLESMYKKIVREIEKQGKAKLIKIAIPVSNFLYKLGFDVRRKIFKDILNNLGGKLRFVVSGASAIDKKVAKGFNDFGILTVQGYGLTETSPVLTAENEKNIRYGSIGYPLENVEVKINNPNEKGIGELIAKGPNVMLGYYENEEATANVLKDGWFYTGDLGYKDKDGYFFITGREKNVIVLKNGKNIYPEELETLINQLPYVLESMVFGMPKDQDLVVSVKIVYNEEYINEKFPKLKEKELHAMIWNDIKMINKGLTNYKHMKNLIITNKEMIKTTTAKIKRFEEIKNIIAETSPM